MWSSSLNSILVQFFQLNWQSRSQSFFTNGGLPPISSSWRQASWDSRPVIFFHLNYCGYSPYVTSSLTKECVCREAVSVVYNCCWTSPAQSSGPSPAGLMTIFYCLRFESPPTWRARSKYLYSSGIGGPVIPQKSELLYDWRFTANQFFLAPGPLRPTTRDFLTELLL
jgi:hypothetical protein